jgi:large subunit ribosomal protein L14
MILLRTLLKVADNTGAHVLEMAGIPGKGNKKIAHVGDVIRAIVKQASPNGMVAAHEKVLAVIVRTKFPIRRSDGSTIKFDDNAAVILENAAEKLPKGTRVFGPIAREIRDLEFNKIVSMAKEVY